MSRLLLFHCHTRIRSIKHPIPPEYLSVLPCDCSTLTSTLNRPDLICDDILTDLDKIASIISEGYISGPIYDKLLSSTPCLITLDKQHDEILNDILIKAINNLQIDVVYKYIFLNYYRDAAIPSNLSEPQYRLLLSGLLMCCKQNANLDKKHINAILARYRHKSAIMDMYVVASAISAMIAIFGGGLYYPN